MRWIAIITVLLLTGCTKLKFLPYLDQALTLQDLSREKEGQEKYVKNIDAKFEALRITIDNGEIKNYKTESRVVKSFGPPIVSQKAVYQGKDAKESVYRYAIQSKGPHKVFIYYDAGGKLIGYKSI